MNELKKMVMNSIEQDREFPVLEHRWIALERELDQSLRKHRHVIRWKHLLFFLMLIFVFGVRQSGITSNSTADRSEGQVAKNEVAIDHGFSRSNAQKVPKNGTKSAIDGNLTLTPASGRNVEKAVMSESSGRNDLQYPRTTRARNAEDAAPSTVQQHDQLETGESMAPSLPENEVAVAIDYSQLLPIDTAGYALVENLEDKNLDKLMPVSKHRSRTMAGIESAPILAGTVRKTSSSGNLGLLLPAAVAPAPYLAPERSGNWQIGLRFGAFFGNNAEYLTYYTTMPNNTTQDQIYLFPSGDTLHLFFAGAVVEKRWRVEVPLLQLDLHRVTASGLGFRLGLTYSIIQSDDTRRTQLIPRRPGIFYYSRESKNVFWAAELGLTYTFNRPKRFQPHVGLSAFAIFSQSSNATTTAFFPDQTYELVESRYRSVSNRLLYGYYWNFGIQWFLDDRFSIGPNFTFTGLPGATSMTIGGGVEARYRW